VILADLSHRVLACEPGSADPARLAGRVRPAQPGAVWFFWAHRLRRGVRWLFTPVGARGEDWGRVILVCDGRRRPDTVLIEREATRWPSAAWLTGTRRAWTGRPTGR